MPTIATLVRETLIWLLGESVQPHVSALKPSSRIAKLAVNNNRLSRNERKGYHATDMCLTSAGCRITMQIYFQVADGSRPWSRVSLMRRCRRYIIRTDGELPICSGIAYVYEVHLLPSPSPGFLPHVDPQRKSRPHAHRRVPPYLVCPIDLPHLANWIVCIPKDFDRSHDSDTDRQVDGHYLRDRRFMPSQPRIHVPHTAVSQAGWFQLERFMGRKASRRCIRGSNDLPKGPGRGRCLLFDKNRNQ
ncbi:hypothetical protein HD806DRAFT_385334 [Xylariaceae sp. AK1471]|nr:hypothetical protein HD806DRAFT_385334 [Xylariaceae sp. AK1471]